MPRRQGATFHVLTGSESEPDGTPTFVIFLIGFVIIFAVLTFLTVLVIAPFAQALTPHLLS